MNTKEHELFEIPTGGKPALLVARERLAGAEQKAEQELAKCPKEPRPAMSVAWVRAHEEVETLKELVHELELQEMEKAQVRRYGAFVQVRTLLVVAALIELLLAAVFAHGGLFGSGVVLMLSGVVTALCAAESGE